MFSFKTRVPRSSILFASSTTGPLTSYNTLSNFVDFLNSIKSHKNINGFVEGTTNATEEKSRSQTIREAFSRLGDRIYKEKDEAGLSMEDDGEVPVDPDDLNAAFYDAHYKKGKLPFHEKVRREGKYIAKKGKLTGKDLLRRFAKNSSRIDTAYRKIADEMEDAAGKENQAELWDEMVDDVAGNYKEYIPSMVGGGLIGSGISLVTVLSVLEPASRVNDAFL